MKSFAEIMEATGLKKMKRKSAKDPSAAGKFAMRQGARSAAKIQDNTVVPRIRGKGGSVPSFQAIGAQFGVDVKQDPKTGEYQNTPWTPTEDKALSVDDPDIMQKQFKQSFVKAFLKKHGKSMGSQAY